MALPKSVRLDSKLDGRVKAYLKTNKLKFSQLVSMAVEKFISEPQTIQLVPADTKTFLDHAEKAFDQHKDAMDKLK